MKKISVIIPCYCASEYLIQCYSSLINQTIGISSLELIFVDDASDDNGKTWNCLLAFEQDYPENITIIQSKENLRQGGARNKALSYASGEYIAFCDADDWLDHTALERAYTYAKNTNADIVQFQHFYYIDEQHIQPQSNTEASFVIEINTIEERKAFLNSEFMGLGCWNKLYRRDMVLQAGVKFAEHVIYEEPLFTYPLLFVINRFAQLNDCLYYYKYNPNGTMMHYMNDMRTLTDHISVQMQVYDFMLNSPYFSNYKDEIDLYFIHTYLYETISFSKLRTFPEVYIIFQHLGGVIRNHFPYLYQNPYLQSDACKKQRHILKLALENASKEEFEEFYAKI